MDHPFQPEFDPPDYVPPLLPPPPPEDSLIGSENPDLDEPGFVDDRFEPTGFGASDDLGIEGEDTVEEVGTASLGIGNTATAASVERSDDDTQPSDAAAAPPPDGHAEADEQTPEAPPAVSDGGDDVPPDIPEAGEGETPPNRGEALRQVLQHAAGSAQRIHDRLRSTVINNAEAVGLGELLEDDWELDEAVGELATTWEFDPDSGQVASTDEYYSQSILHTTLSSELTEAQTAYRSALADAGVQYLSRNLRELAIEITDPAAYTEALEQLHAAGTTEAEREVLHRQADMTFEHALDHATLTLVGSNQPEALVACNGVIPDSAQFTTPPEEQDISAERVDFANKLVANAGRIATVLTAMGTPDDTVAPVRQLGIAHTEGRTVEWAVGYSIDVIGSSMLPIGIERLALPEEWAPVYGYLTYLQAAAPASVFAEEVRSTLLSDLYEASFAPIDESWFEDLYPDDAAYRRALSDAIERIIQIMPR